MNARRGLSGGCGTVSVFGRCWAAIPARALSRSCAASATGPAAIRAKSSAVAGECGNRTHPTLRRRVTVILKITEATRPHPPPLHSANFDRNFSPLNDLADDYSALDS